MTFNCTIVHGCQGKKKDSCEDLHSDQRHPKGQRNSVEARAERIMKVLTAFANWAWGNNPNPDVVSPEQCMDHLFSVPCLTALALKMVGIAIIAGACLNKAPVVKNILVNKSVAGMATGSVYAETIMYANAAFYSLLRGNPFTAWGENGILTVQCLVVCTLLWKYKDDPKITVQQQFYAMAAFSTYLIGVFHILQPEYYYLLLSVNQPVMIYSRGVQIYTFYTCKHTGSMSLVTTTMNLVGSLIRTVTTIGEVGYDWALLSGYLMSICLNGTQVAQFMIYKEGTKKYLASISQKKKD